ncbi:hypothetical protein [Mycolicibacterium sediminis]|nr:hypothetical protein [Mycolicibacterium sediminis]
MKDANAPARVYTPDTGWKATTDNYAMSVAITGEWDEIDSVDVKAQIERMEAKRMKRGG